MPLTHRLAQGWAVTNGFGGAMPQLPKYYAERFFYDSLVYEPGYRRHLVTDFAPGQIFGGTDYPYAIMETGLHDFLMQAGSNAQASLFSGAAKRFLGRA